MGFSTSVYLCLSFTNHANSTPPFYSAHEKVLYVSLGAKGCIIKMSINIIIKPQQALLQLLYF